jgi:UDP-N-acetylmuramoyl-tripeptide--D-alanyl-D-alanine ligase
MPFVAVTGSAGKSSSKEMIARMLGKPGEILAPEGSFNNAIGLPLTILRAGPAHKYAVVEIGTNAPGEIRTLASVARPEVGVITMAGAVHLEKLGSVEGVAREKGDLLDCLAPGGVAVLNRDDPFFEYWRKRARGRCVSFGFSPEADVRPDAVETAAGHVLLRMPGGPSVRLETPARHQAANALAALAAGKALGLPIAECAARLSGYAPMDGRFSIHRDMPVTLIDDAYNASPVSFRAALETLRTMRGSRRVLIAADMLELGDAASEFHRRLGEEIAAAGVDVLHAVGPLAAEAARAAAEAGLDRSAIRIHPDAESAASAVPPQLEPGDIVLVKGSHGTGVRAVAEAIRARFAGGAGKSRQDR